jgi:coenzyme F420-reducing hydrogenase alpha subunit
VAQTIQIDPVTRIEGHGKVTLLLDEQGRVHDARFCIKEFRGFEKMCQGALAETLPLMTSRICGICPVSHHLSSVKAVEDCFGVQVPPTAVKLRELMLLGQLLESHMLSLAVLSLPDFAFPDDQSNYRNVVGLYQSNREAIVKTFEIRAAGTEIVQALGRRPGHPIGARIGGMALPLSEQTRDELMKRLQTAEPHLVWFAQIWRALAEKNAESIAQLGDIRTGYLALSKNNSLAFYEGDVRVVAEDMSSIATFPTKEYFSHVEERTENWSYMKFPVLKSGQRFRVGPLARINLADGIPTPLAGRELEWFRQRWSRPAHKTLCYHHARLIEAIYAFERAKELLSDPAITDHQVWSKPEIRAGVGVGIVEAPRGTLVHRYELDDKGQAVRVDLVVATQHNNYAFNDALRETASRLIHNDNPDAATLNKLEMIIRAFDPCLSCSTHLLGQNSFSIELYDHCGNLVREWR